MRISQAHFDFFDVSIFGNIVDSTCLITGSTGWATKHISYDSQRMEPVLQSAKSREVAFAKIGLWRGNRHCSDSESQTSNFRLGSTHRIGKPLCGGSTRSPPELPTSAEDANRKIA